MFKTFLALLFLRSSRAFRIVHAGSQARCSKAFWMGLLPEQSCDVISEKSYSSGKRIPTDDRYLDGSLHFWEELAVRAWFARS